MCNKMIIISAISIIYIFIMVVLTSLCMSAKNGDIILEETIFESE